MNREAVEQCNNLMNVIKQEVQKQVDKEYTEYKLECLKDLDYKLEMKRNECVKKILDGIDILLSADNPMSLEPTILIKVEKKVILNDQKRNSNNY